MTDKGIVAEIQRVVVKVGSSTLTDQDGRLDADYIATIASQVATLREEGCQVIIVTSAAIVAGLEALGFSGARPSDIPTLQAAASVGQVGLTRVYADAFARFGLSIGQVLLTRHDTADREVYLHARNTIERLLALGVVPIVNENDTVATDEICFGDNDTLAALVATLVSADLVVLLTDIEGLYTADPRLDEDAALLEHVGAFTDALLAAAGGAGSTRGSGGMLTKINAARVLMTAGIPTVICEGHRPRCILAAVGGENIGTRFDSEVARHHITARKLWIALGGTPHGTLIVDDGAALALRDKGSSLLPVGVRRVEGSFSAGDAVDIRDGGGHLVGRGLTNYSSDEAALTAGRKTEELASNTLLAHLADTVLIHRDELLVF